ncbi:MAG TPA: hypothetical protein VND93_32170 [Myxococcales bacterium]|nr:hypothetical protein [Myxococcales bacterium]
MAEQRAPAPASGFIWAVAVGLCAAFLIGGAALGWAGYRTVSRPFDCGGLAQDECVMEQDIALGWARYQLGFGIGLVALGTAMVLWLWYTERGRPAAAAKE